MSRAAAVKAWISRKRRGGGAASDRPLPFGLTWGGKSKAVAKPIKRGASKPVWGLK